MGVVVNLFGDKRVEKPSERDSEQAKENLGRGNVSSPFGKNRVTESAEPPSESSFEAFTRGREDNPLFRILNEMLPDIALEEAQNESGATESSGNYPGEFQLQLRWIRFQVSQSARRLLNLNPSLTSVRDSRLVVKDYCTVELLETLENINELSWAKRAGFYRAIFEELDFRFGKK